MHTEFKIPPDFDRVVKKLYPEIEEINITHVETFQNWGITEMPGDERYIITLSLVLNPKGPSVYKETYGENINQLFVFTYGDSDFVKFVVEQFVILKPQTKREKFMELFYAPH